MTEPIKRNVAVASVVAVLVLVALCYYYFYVKVHPPSPDNVVKVTVEPVKLPEEFQNTLQSLGVKGLILVGEGEAPIIRAIASDGTPIELCSSGPETDKSDQPSCRLATTPKALVNHVSGAGNPGICLAGGYMRCCHKNNHKWPCHDRGGHYSCQGPCQ
jgi:hypothetical protein